MPELPEVETIRRALQARVAGEKIVAVDILHPKVIAPLTESEFREHLVGATLTGMERRGKYLLCALDRPGLLTVHLRMTGQLHWVTEEQPLMPHTHLIFHMASGNELRYVDIRRFGKVRYLGSIAEDDTLANLGPEPLSDAFTAQDLHNLFLKRKAAIKAVLLDQALLAGLGNIYTDEALFLAGIHPERGAVTLSDAETDKLWQTIRFVLQESIEYRGSSLRDYCNIDGQRGQYQEMWRVYQQTGKACPNCGTAIERIVVRGRSSHFCPQCQK